MTKKWIDLQTDDGICDSYVSFPEGGKSLPCVFLLMDAVGLRPRICDMADRIASEGYFVLTPNLFYRSHRAPVVDYDTLLKKENLPELFKQVMVMASQLNPELSQRDMNSYFDFLAVQPNVDAEKIAAVGYCLGGCQALRAAGNFPAAFKVVASFHAGNLAVDTEISPSRWFKSIKAEVYIGHADNDKSMPHEQMDRVKAELEAAKLCSTTELYKDCLHGWTMKDLPAYNAQGEEHHWNQLLALFRRCLK